MCREKLKRTKYPKQLKKPCITCRAFGWRRELFTDEGGSQKREGCARLYRLKKYEDILKGANKKIIIIVGNQGELLRKFKEEDGFFD